MHSYVYRWLLQKQLCFLKCRRHCQRDSNFSHLPLETVKSKSILLGYAQRSYAPKLYALYFDVKILSKLALTSSFFEEFTELGTPDTFSDFLGYIVSVNFFGSI